MDTDSPRRLTVLVIGPVPPPEFGVAKATRLMVESAVLSGRMRLVHLDTSDHRTMATMGRLEWGNVSLGIRHLARLVRLLAKERPDLVLLTVSQGKLALVRDGLFVLAARTFRSRVVSYLRGSGYADIRASQGKTAACVLRRVLRASSRVIVLGDSLVPMAHAIYQDTRVAVVPNGCPPAVVADRVGTRNEGRPLLLYLGALSAGKGVSDALQAARLVAAAVPTLEFLLCGQWGSPAFQAETLSSVQRDGLSSVVRFPGPVSGDEKAALLGRTWAVVVPSRSEGQPWVILEAMSAGVPVVATDTGAIAETIQDGISGFVVPVGDVESLARSAVTLLQDDDLWRRMSREAVRRYQERFTLERSHTALAEVLEQVARED